MITKQNKAYIFAQKVFLPFLKQIYPQRIIYQDSDVQDIAVTRDALAAFGETSQINSLSDCPVYSVKDTNMIIVDVGEFRLIYDY